MLLVVVTFLKLSKLYNLQLDIKYLLRHIIYCLLRFTSLLLNTILYTLKNDKMTYNVHLKHFEVCNRKGNNVNLDDCFLMEKYIVQQ